MLLYLGGNVGCCRYIGSQLLCSVPYGRGMDRSIACVFQFDFSEIFPDNPGGIGRICQAGRMQ